MIQKNVTQRDTRTLQRIVHTDWFSPLSDITDKLNSSLDTTLHNNSTVRRYLHEMDIGSYSQTSFNFMQDLYYYYI